MASKHHTINPDDSGSDGIELGEYANCLVTPMADKIRKAHVIDAVLVAGIVFFAVILGDVLLSITNGQPAYLTTQEITSRIPTAAIAFGLTFFVQAARARGIDILERLGRIIE